MRSRLRYSCTALKRRCGDNPNANRLTLRHGRTAGVCDSAHNLLSSGHARQQCDLLACPSIPIGRGGVRATTDKLSSATFLPLCPITPMHRQRKLVLGIVGLPFYLLLLLYLFLLLSSPALRYGSDTPASLPPAHSHSLLQLGPSASLAIFNVFLDRRPSDNQTEVRSYNGHVNGVLRVILVKRRGFQPRLHCRFDDGTDVPARDLHGNLFAFYELTENHQRLYGGYSVHCDVPPLAQLTNGVAIWIDGPEHGRTFLPVIHANASKMEILPSQRALLNKPQYKHRFVVCVPAMHHTRTLNTAFLTEWFKVHIRLGVTKFRIYYSEPLSRTLQELIQSVQCQVEVDLYPLFWKENNRAVQQDSWYYLQTMTVNDCLLRSLYDTEYAFFGDLDEVLVPHQPNLANWSDLVRAVWNEKSIPGICFPAYKFYGPAASMSASLLRSTRVDRIRSKCLVRPSAIFEMGIHHISKPFEETASARPKTTPDLIEYAFIHHYHRLPARRRDQSVTEVVDTSILRFMGM